MKCGPPLRYQSAMLLNQRPFLRQTARLACVLLFPLAGACGGHAFVSVEQDNPPLVFHGVKVFDAATGKLLDGVRDVVVKDGRITAVETEPQTVAGAREVTGGVLLPGLIDLHVHLGGGSEPPWKTPFPKETEVLTAFLYAGVTTVLDVGNVAPDVFELRDSVAQGKTLGPRIFAAGPMFTTVGGHPAAAMRLIAPWLIGDFIVSKTVREIANPAQAAVDVDALAVFKPDFIKLAVDRIPLDAPRMDTSLTTAITAAARKHNLRTVAHVGRSQDVIDAVAGGVSAMVHGVDLETISDEAIQALARGGVPVVPTHSVFDVQERLLPDTRWEFSRLEQEMAHPDIMDAIRHVPAGLDKSPLYPWALAVGAGGFGEIDFGGAAETHDRVDPLEFEGFVEVAEFGDDGGTEVGAALGHAEGAWRRGIEGVPALGAEADFNPGVGIGAADDELAGDGIELTAGVAGDDSGVEINGAEERGHGAGEVLAVAAFGVEKEHLDGVLTGGGGDHFEGVGVVVAEVVLDESGGAAIVGGFALGRVERDAGGREERDGELADAGHVEGFEAWGGNIFDGVRGGFDGVFELPAIAAALKGDIVAG